MEWRQIVLRVARQNNNYQTKSDNQAVENNGQRNGSEVQAKGTRRDAIMAGMDKVGKAEESYFVVGGQGG
jgi:hypothetical protein